MSHCLIKVAPDIDNLYADWSSITENFHGWGPREEISDWSAIGWGEGVFAAADKFGSTSSLEGRWGQDFIYEQRGILGRDDVFEFLCLLTQELDDEAHAMLRPFDE